MRARYFGIRAPGDSYVLVAEIDAEEPDGVWEALQARAVGHQGLAEGDIVYIGDQYFRLNGDGGWDLISPSELTRRLYPLIVEASESPS